MRRFRCDKARQQDNGRGSQDRQRDETTLWRKTSTTSPHCLGHRGATKGGWSCIHIQSKCDIVDFAASMSTILYHTIPYHTIAVAIKFRKTPNIVGILWKMCVLSTFSFYTNASIVYAAARVLLAEWKLLNENAILFFLFFLASCDSFWADNKCNVIPFVVIIVATKNYVAHTHTHTQTHSNTHLYGVEN